MVNGQSERWLNGQFAYHLQPVLCSGLVLRVNASPRVNLIAPFPKKIDVIDMIWYDNCSTSLWLVKVS